jgi:adenylate cyclase class 2
VSSNAAEDREQEVKFYLTDPPALQARLDQAGVHLVQPRIHEFNLRFDTAGNDLSREERVLRLRQDAESWLTYKGPEIHGSEVTDRQEIEIRVDDFSSARRLFEALGFHIEFIYEKYRSAYSLEAGSAGGSGPVLVTLDHLPFGDFAEIEGPDPGSIRSAASSLGLDWEARILQSYSAMFKHVKARLGLDFRDLTFANFQPITVTSSDLGVMPADARD